MTNQIKSQFLVSLDDYKDSKKIGCDSISSFYLITHKKTSKKYIARELRLGFSLNDEDYSKQCDEVDALMYFRHPTFINYIGYSLQDFHKSKGIIIITERSRNIEEMLQFNQKKGLPKDYTNTSRQIILIGIARAMMLLHQTKFLHCLLSLENIYMDKNYHPKLNISFTTSKEDIKECVPLYAPPEIFDGNFNDKSDVYSFAIIMYAILNDTMPFQLESIKMNTFQFIQKVRDGYRPQFEKPIKESFKKLINQCWAGNPEDRPSFEKIYNLLAFSNEDDDENSYFLDDVDVEKIYDYLEEIKGDIYLPTCYSCNKRIKYIETIFYSGYPYHKDCVKCIVCGQTIKSDQDTSDFISITNGVFLCKKHYTIFRNTHELPQAALDKIKAKSKQNAVNDILNPKFFNDADILNQNPNNIFITHDMADNSFQNNKPYEHFTPVVTFHFENSPEYVKFDELEKIFDKNLIIFSINKGSTILKSAYVGPKENLKKYISSIKNSLSSQEAKSIIGKLVEEPKIKIPKGDINNIYKNVIAGELQNSDELNETEINELKNEVLKKIVNEKVSRNWPLISCIQSLLIPIEKQINLDIRNNPFEMVVVGQTILVSDYFKYYNSLKKNLSKNKSIKIKERILYHGSMLSNHQKIVKSHFLMPGKDKQINQTDDGYYGQGIYATNNMFYASMYGNGFSMLTNNQKAPVICCNAIYNESKVNEISDKSYYGKKISPKISKLYGIHHTLVGDSKNYWPISPSDIDKNFLVAEEFVFPVKYQLLPVCSILVMRADHLIIWKDENINNDENSKYFKDLSVRLKLRFYSKDNIDETIQLINLKKRNRIKLITNGGENLTGKKLIEKARQIIKSNFICLVFSKSMDHLKWINKMENVVFTNEPEMFKKFAALHLCKKDVLDFVHKLELRYKNKFKINEDELLKFPLARNI